MKETRMAFWRRWHAMTRMYSTPGPRYCSECGAGNDPEAQVCSNCGKMLNP